MSPIPSVDSLGHKISKQTIHISVKYLLLQQLSIYHLTNIVDGMNHIPDDQDDLIFQPKNKIQNFFI